MIREKLHKFCSWRTPLNHMCTRRKMKSGIICVTTKCSVQINVRPFKKDANNICMSDKNRHHQWCSSFHICNVNINVFRAKETCYNVSATMLYSNAEWACFIHIYVICLKQRLHNYSFAILRCNNKWSCTRNVWLVHINIMVFKKTIHDCYETVFRSNEKRTNTVITPRFIG